MSLEKQGLSMQKITMGLSVHRPEMIPLIEDRMRRTDAISLEEPPAVGFDQMLTGTHPVDNYLNQLDVEYPSLDGKCAIYCGNRTR